MATKTALPNAVSGFEIAMPMPSATDTDAAIPNATPGILSNGGFVVLFIAGKRYNSLGRWSLWQLRKFIP